MNVLCFSILRLKRYVLCKKDTSGRLLLQLLIETHLEVVKGLIQLRGFNQYINNKTSSERCYYVQTEQTDICYANAKKLLQSGKTYIGVAFISLVPFRQLSFLDRGQLISYIHIHLPPLTHKYRHTRR